MTFRNHGVYPVLYAFFDAEGGLDEDAMRRQVEHCIAVGAHGICVLGLVTEVDRMDAAGRLALVRLVGRLIGGRLPYAVTVGEPTTEAQIAFCAEAEKAGASWVILQPPPGGRSEADIIEFFTTVARAVSLPVAIQNNPVNLASYLSVQGLVDVVRANTNVTILKAEGWSVDIARVLEGLDGKVDAFGGHGGIEFLSLLRSGGAGLIPAPDCLALQVRIYNLVREGTHEALATAEAIHRELLPLIIFMTRNIRGLVHYGKIIMADNLGLKELHHLPGGIEPTAFGLGETQRLIADLRRTEARFLAVSGNHP